MLTLVLGTHEGKLYSASALVLALSASCSWDGSTHRRLLQLNPSIDLVMLTLVLGTDVGKLYLRQPWYLI
jgi:hypothetical protein